MEQEFWPAPLLDDLPNLEGAACTQVDNSAFFPTELTGQYADLAYVRGICRECPVRLACLEWALEHNEVGIWAGTTEADRRRIKKKGAAA